MSANPFWVVFWAVFLVVSVGGFAVVLVAITLGAWADLKRLLAKRADERVREAATGSSAGGRSPPA